MTALPIGTQEHAERVELYESPEAWPEPEPLPTVHPPAFPVAALGELRTYVAAVAEALQVPPELPGCMALAVIGSALARKARVVVRGEWSEPLNLYTLTALDSGNRKTAAVEEVTAPVRLVEAELLAEAEPVIASAELRRRMREQERDALVRDATKTTGDTTARDHARRAADMIARELASEAVPVLPRLLVKDATPEQIAVLLAEQGGRLACFSAEGEVFGPLMGRYTRDGGVNIETFLSAHSGGDSIRVDRRGAKAITVDRPALTLGLSVQPDVLRSLTKDAALRGRGLVARFLYALPASPLGSRKLEPEPVPGAVRENWHRLVRQLYALPRPEREEVISLTPEARAVFRQLEADVEKDLGPGGRFTGWVDWGGKLAGAVARIAAILHAADYSRTLREPWAVPIAPGTMRAAVELGAYFTQHARLAFATMYGDHADALAARLHPWVIRRESFTARECYRAHPGLEQDQEKIAADGGPLALLEEHNIIRREPPPPGPKGGRPSIRFLVNPKARAVP